MSHIISIIFSIHQKKGEKVKHNSQPAENKEIINGKKIPGFYIDEEIIDAYNNEPDFY